ncbi:hypothetical protein ACFS07_35695 [Undibacterium arcticum]
MQKKKIEVPIPPPIPGQPPASAPQPDWSEFSFDYETDELPQKKFAEVIVHKKNGVRIRQIIVKLNDEDATLKFKVSGDIYAKL